MGSLQGIPKLNHYPSLTDAEFEEGCRALEAKCCDNLEGTNWLSVRWHNGELEVKQRAVVGWLGGGQILAKNEKGIGMGSGEEDDDVKDAECYESDGDMVCRIYCCLRFSEC